MNLYVFDSAHKNKIPVHVVPASTADFASTKIGWQTDWTSQAAGAMPNKVALKQIDNGELLALMSYSVSHEATAVEIIYIENAGHSNANYLGHAAKKYLDVPRPLFAYAAKESIDAGFDGVLVLRAKTTKHIDYYCREFRAQQVAPHSDPFRLVIWDDDAKEIIESFEKEGDSI